MVGVPLAGTLLSLSGVLYFPVQVARAPAVQEVNYQANGQPHDEANDGNQRQAHNQ